MKVFLMYYDRYQSATTSLMLNREHIVLCHSNKEMFTCISNKATVIETGLPKGIQNNFNYGLGLLEDGEWGVFMSDDLVCGRELTGKNFTRVDHNYVLDVFINKVNKIQNNRINLIGMNATGNELNSTRDLLMVDASLLERPNLHFTLIYKLYLTITQPRTILKSMGQTLCSIISS